jgi:hypothetical protein
VHHVVQSHRKTPKCGHFVIGRFEVEVEDWFDS